MGSERGRTGHQDIAGRYMDRQKGVGGVGRKLRWERRREKGGRNETLHFIQESA